MFQFNLLPVIYRFPICPRMMYLYGQSVNHFHAISREGILLYNMNHRYNKVTLARAFCHLAKDPCKCSHFSIWTYLFPGLHHISSFRYMTLLLCSIPLDLLHVFCPPKTLLHIYLRSWNFRYLNHFSCLISISHCINVFCCQYSIRARIWGFNPSYHHKHCLLWWVFLIHDTVHF